MPSALGHKQTPSLSQNHKAQLANAYNELGKELSSSKIRVVGNYTLGRVIGEGMGQSLIFCVSNSLFRRLWQGQNGHTSLDVNKGSHQTDSQGHVCIFDS